MKTQKNSGEAEPQKPEEQLPWAEAPAWVILRGPGPGREQPRGNWGAAGGSGAQARELETPGGTSRGWVGAGVPERLWGLPLGGNLTRRAAKTEPLPLWRGRGKEPFWNFPECPAARKAARGRKRLPGPGCGRKRNARLQQALPLLRGKGNQLKPHPNPHGHRSLEGHRKKRKEVLDAKTLEQKWRLPLVAY